MIRSNYRQGDKSHERTCARVKRVRALLATNCLTYTEIGKRVGLSRERIRQLVNLLGVSISPIERHAICKMNRPLKLVPTRPLVALAMAELDRLGIPYTECGKFLRIRDKLCMVQSMPHHGINTGSVSAARVANYVQLRRSTIHTDFTIGKVNRGGPWFIIPWDTMPDVVTTFSLDPKPNMGGKSNRHDYLFYKERWDLLK